MRVVWVFSCPPVGYRQNVGMQIVSGLLIAIIVISATLVLPLALVPRHRHPELRIWAGALGIHALAYGLFALRGQISDLFSVVFAHLALAQALALFYQGLCRFQKANPRAGSPSRRC